MLLNDDQRGPIPHFCVAFAATSRIPVTVARISAAFRSDAITQEALSICSLLIDSEEEFLQDRGFADILPEFIESIQQCLRRGGDPDIESSMVELLFGIAAKLRVEPHVLRVWFRPEKPEEDDEELSEDERRTRWEEFPLFYLLLNYVPSEGRTGEFGRMALLYIIEMASHSLELEKWLIAGDMAALMGSSLGALYSQLSRKLALKYPEGETPPILTFSERLEAEIPADAEATTSMEYQAHLGTFLASLVFWQDLLEHCTSNDVKQTLLDHFQYLFLQQLLYPSLLESSDIDGGSSVAVLTYLRHILESIDHPDLVRLTLVYLFGLQQQSKDVKTAKTPTFLARRRKSQTLIAQLAKQDQPTPELFNLSDLIMASLRSKSQQTITATLHILSAMLRRPHHQSLTTLLRTRPVQALDTTRTMGGQEKEVEKFLSIAEGLTAFQDLESSFDRHVTDNRNTLEMHPCTAQLLSLPVSNKNALALESGKKDLRHKLLLPEDPTFKSLVGLLDNFFHNDVETNLGVTQVLVDLASCGYMRLEGWLLTSPSLYEYPNQPPPPPSEDPLFEQRQNELTPEKLYRLKLSRLPPRIAPATSSPIIQCLTQLTKIVDTFRRTIPSFDAHLLTCRSIIEPSPSNASSPNPTPSRSPSRADQTDTPRPSRHTAPIHPSTPIPIPSRLNPSNASTPARTGSPRGRQTLSDPTPDLGTPPSLVARLGHLGSSPTRSSPSHSATGTPSKGLSRSPLRREALTVPSRGPAIPNILRRRVRITTAAGRGPSGTYSRLDKGAVDSSEEEFGRDGRDGQGSGSESDTSVAGGDGATVGTPSKKMTPAKAPHLAVRTKRGHRKTLSASSVGRGRDMAALNDMESFSDGEEDQGGRSRGGEGEDEGIGITSPTAPHDERKGSSDGTWVKDRKARRGMSVSLPVGADAYGRRGGGSRNGATESKTSTGRDGEAGDSDDKEGTVSLGQLCTNVIVLQEFALELAAIVEVRGALFDEVRYF